MSLDFLASERVQLKAQLLQHPLFSALQNQAQLCQFMQAHVFAVWDFMSLVKRLQREFCASELPWLPPQDPKAARLINEIVLGEESDADGQGGFISHFELYREAMRDIGADTQAIDAFVKDLQRGRPVLEALDAASVLPSVKQFTRLTLAIAQEGQLEEVLGFFFFGREAMIPNLFQNLLARWGIAEQEVPRLSYYLHRHIQLDHEEHGPAAEALIERFVGHDHDKRLRLEQAGVRAIKARIELWDGVLGSLS